jgi:hypothetical protein
VSTKSGGAPARPAITFNDDIQPLLADNCYACHGADPGSRKAQLRLDRAEYATAARKDGPPAIVPGKPDESGIVQRIESKDEKKVMPPPESHKTLKPEQIALLRRWIAGGPSIRNTGPLSRLRVPPSPRCRPPGPNGRARRLIVSFTPGWIASNSPQRPRRTVARCCAA